MDAFFHELLNQSMKHVHFYEQFWRWNWHKYISTFISTTTKNLTDTQNFDIGKEIFYFCPVLWMSKWRNYACASGTWNCVLVYVSEWGGHFVQEFHCYIICMRWLSLNSSHMLNGPVLGNDRVYLPEDYMTCKS